MIFCLVLATALASCRGKSSGRKSSGGGGEGGGGEENQPSAPNAPVDQLEKTNDVGVEDVPPVKDDLISIDTTDKPAIKHLVMTSTDKEEDGRRLSEFLVIVRASESSCIRLRVRPSDGLASPLDKKFIGVDQDGSEACAEAKLQPEAPAPKEEEKTDDSKTDVSKEVNKQTGKLRLAALTAMGGNASKDWSQLQFGKTAEPQLMLATPALCSSRVFRMAVDKSPELGQAKGIEKVQTKTGRLVAKSASNKINVWLDAETGSPCLTGHPADLPLTFFGPLIQTRTYASTEADLLRVSHYQNLADSAEDSLSKLTGQFGAVSDVDGNGALDIFISPDVNRLYIAPQYIHRIDGFTALPPYRPEDLASYNAQTNPTSNEGEIIYMWAPDPGGIYNYDNFPSSNSISSNYAKGYAAFQIASMIIANQKLLINKVATPEKDWLTRALAFQLSQYVAGIDYSFIFLSHYLTSRTNEVSLTERPDEKLVPESYLGVAFEEKLGMEAFLGWYLHTRFCGTNVTACLKLKELVDSKLLGEEAVAAIAGESFMKDMNHFGASVGTALVDNPAAARSLWTTAAASTSMPPLPVTFPELTQISANSPPQTIENEKNGDGPVAEKTDRTVAGPFPSKDTLVFQPILPDQSMDLPLAKNAVGYILVTGLVEKDTDVTAVIGKGLNVLIVPLGDRDSAIRNIYPEKVSETAHLDLRPLNLTTAVNPHGLNYDLPAVPDTSPFMVTPKREIWMLGSADNFDVAVEGSAKTVGDTDAVVFTVDPCEGASDLAACQATSHTVVVQVLPRSGGPQLKPVVVATPSERGIFRGRVLWGEITELDPQFKYPTNETTTVYAICQSETSFAGIPSSLSSHCANGGLSAAEYQSQVCNTPGHCGGFEASEASTFTAYNTDLANKTDPKLKNYGFELMADNYLHSHPFGFPFYNYYHLWPETGAPEMIGDRVFIAEEARRQFFNFGFTKSAQELRYRFFTTSTGVSFDLANLITLSEQQAADLAEIKDIIDNFDNKSPPATEPLSDDDTTVKKCTGLGFTSENCKNPKSKASALQSEAIKYMADKRVVCYDENCSGKKLVVDGSPLKTTRWLDPSRLVQMAANFSKTSDGAGSFITYYRPLRFLQKSGICSGAPNTGNALSPNGECRYFNNSQMNDADIRYQLNVDYGRLITNSLSCGTIGSDFRACFDPYSKTEEVQPDRLWGAIALSEKVATNRTRKRGGLIYSRAGEIVGKPLRIYPLLITIPGNKATDVAIILGGRRLSQGKYILRARVKDYELESTN